MANQEFLSYGIIVTRLDDGDWWHGHFVRTDLEYDCKLLGRRTNLLFLMVKFGCGVSRKSADFYLTLDGEGVSPELCPIRVNGDWGESADNGALRQEAMQIQESLAPQLYESAEFQSAMASIVRTQTYGVIATAARFFRLRGEL